MLRNKKHACSLGLGSYSMLPKKGGLCNEICRSLWKLLLVSEKHPGSFQHFRSFPALVAERQRYLLSAGWLVVHPFSMFNLIWRMFMLLIDLAHMVTSSTRLCFILEPPDNMQRQHIDQVMLGLHVTCLLDILINFNVGYVEEPDKYIMLRRSSIACNYLKHWFIFDFLSSVPVAYILLGDPRKTQQSVLIAHCLPLFRCSRIYITLINVKKVSKVFTRSYVWQRLTRHAILFLMMIHWSTCLLYLPSVLQYYSSGNWTSGYVSFLTPDLPLIEHTTAKRYQKGAFISFSIFLSTGFSMFNIRKADEMVLNSVMILSHAIFMVYTVVLILKTYMTEYNSSKRYNELMNQVEKYMRQKQFPAQLKKRVLSFYRFRYQERYFKEDTAFDCLSEQLRNEIILHTCHKLVNKVALLEGLPATVVGTVLGCLKPEVYLPEDLIVRAGETGDCMYFLAYGSVAVYSLKGAEVCHLVDGAHFGEVALLMKDSKRVATVIAIEITQVYRLDSIDFRRFVITNPALYERIETLASQRMHDTVILDEEYRQRKEKQKQSGDFSGSPRSRKRRHLVI